MTRFLNFGIPFTKLFSRSNENGVAFNSKNCSSIKFALFSTNVRASYNGSTTNEVIFVISVNIKSLNKKEFIGFNSLQNSNEQLSSYKGEKRKIVNLSSSESIGSIEYDCCSGVKTANKVNLSQNRDFTGNGWEKDRRFYEERIFEDIR